MSATTGETYADRARGSRWNARALVRGRAEDSPWVRPALLALLAGTALLYLVGLAASGWGNSFYAAAVQAATQSWKAFFFGSFDSSNFITVDKPPASLWVMELSGRLFGFSSWSMLVPQALEGVAAVALLYATVRRWFSQPAALLSGAVLALTPVAALMFRFNNPDALLVLLLVLGAYAVTRALERGSARWLALAGAALGFGFLTKMFQAFLVLPAFALVYLVAAPTPLRRRLGHLLVGLAALVVSSGWWIAVVELVPASARPYVGGSTNNSIIDLIWGYNGLGRIDGGAGVGGGGGGNFSGPPGLLRLFNAEMGGQISWLLPAALVALAAGAWVTRRAARTDRHRAALILWGGWLLVTGLVYSYMSGIIHPYYTNTLAPAIAALVGIGVALLWSGRRLLVARVVLAVMLGATAVWAYALLERTPSWHPWLRYAVLGGGLATAALIVAAGGVLTRPAAAALAAAALLAGVGGPVAFDLATASSAQTGSIVAAGPASAGGGRAGFGGPGGSAPASAGMFRPTGSPPARGLTRTAGSMRIGGGGGNVGSALISLLKQNASSYEWVAATTSAGNGASIELATGKAVMAIGGFTGSDQSITLVAFKQLVAAGKVHYFIGGGGGGGGGRGGGVADQIASWASSTFKSTTVGGTTVYDLTG